jgi:large subunit ribosomal protein L24e
MVLKRQCSFCAGEVEPGTGTMYVKRDGTIFYFCTSSCRKQQLKLGRVGHRLKWTRAHSMKQAAEKSSAAGRGARAAKPGQTTPKRSPAAPSAPATAPPAAAPATPAPAAPPAPNAAGKEPPATTEPVAEKKPRARKPKTPPAASP